MCAPVLKYAHPNGIPAFNPHARPPHHSTTTPTYIAFMITPPASHTTSADDSLVRHVHELQQLSFASEQAADASLQGLESLSGRLQAVGERNGAVSYNLDAMGVKLNGILHDLKALLGLAGEMSGVESASGREKEQFHAHIGMAYRGEKGRPSERMAHKKQAPSGELHLELFGDTSYSRNDVHVPQPDALHGTNGQFGAFHGAGRLSENLLEASESFYAGLSLEQTRDRIAAVQKYLGLAHHQFSPSVGHDVRAVLGSIQDLASENVQDSAARSIDALAALVEAYVEELTR